MSEVLLRTLERGVLTLTMNRPDRLNALTWELMWRLLEAVREAAIDPGVRVVVLRGAGRGFCSGGDIGSEAVFAPEDRIAAQWSSDPSWKSLEQRVSQIEYYGETALLLHTMAKPTIAAVRGPAAGAGVSLAAACDMRIASETAVFTTAFVAAARSGDYGGSYTLTKLLGTAKARELYLLGDKVDAAEALRLGLVNRVVGDDALEAETEALAKRFAEGPAAAYRYIKRNLNAAEAESFANVLALEAVGMARCSQSEDAREVFLARREKRAPIFKGY
jgi:2-(1,2-epoxy-1,2-dihydrophenyl)acetyl-CoA isomerase